MADLLNRPRPGQGSDSRAARVAALAAAVRAPRPGDRPLAVTAPVAGAVASVATLVTCLAVGVLGWFLTDGGAHGTQTGAMHVGALAWLMAHGAALTYGGVHYTVVPLGLTLLLVWASYLCGRWAGRTAPPLHDRDLAAGVGLFTSAYLIVGVLTAVLAGGGSATASLPQALAGCLLLPALAGGAGMLAGCDRWTVLALQLPTWVAPMVRSALAIALLVEMASTVVLAVSLALHFGTAASLLSDLGLHTPDAILLTLVCLVATPNATGMTAAYLLGPGFAVGVGTTVAPTVVTLGAVPAFPLLAALPAAGPVPWWTTALMALPPVVAALGGFRVQRRYPVLTWEAALVRGLGSGVLAGVLVTLWVWLCGGSLGSGRMADLGSVFLPVLGSAVLTLGLGGLVGSLLATVLARRTAARQA